MSPAALTNRQAVIAVALLWLIAVFAGLYFRPLMPIDETRYVTVAWEMHLADHWLVPLLNGEAYHHKPPLLFWVIRLGWLVFGVSETWARLVAPLFGLGALGLAAWLGRLLWQGETGQRVGNAAPVIVLTAAWWMLFATLTFFDLIMAFFALLGWIGLVLNLHYGRRWTGTVLTGIAIGFGILAKGPAILVYVLPVAVLAPVWTRNDRKTNWIAWYGGVLLSLLIGAGIGLAWALPAAEAGGEAYKQALLWGQTAGRVRDSFAHRRPVWWYLPLLPLLVLPWSLWLPSWRALAVWRRQSEPGLRFGLVVCLAGLAIFSGISGKQPQYLLPLLPAFALVLARGMTRDDTAPSRVRDVMPLLAFLVVLALAAILLPAVLGVSPKLENRLDLPDWAQEKLLEFAALLLVGVFASWWATRRGGSGAGLVGVVVPAVCLFLAVHVFGFAPARPVYDLQATASTIRGAQDAGRPIAYVGDYHGQYQFVGRLSRPLQEIEHNRMLEWLDANPSGWVVARHREEHLDTTAKPVYAQQERGRIVAIWDAAAVASDRRFFATIR